MIISLCIHQIWCQNSKHGDRRGRLNMGKNFAIFHISRYISETVR